MSRTVLIVGFLFFMQGLFAQVQLSWEDFADIDFEPAYNEVYEIYFLKPAFGEKIKQYQGKEVRITGYFLNIAGDGEVLLVSQNPMASCFFCGASGPESVVEINFKKKPSFKTDDMVTITGNLTLNKFDVDHFNYILNDAEGKLAKE